MLVLCDMSNKMDLVEQLRLMTLNKKLRRFLVRRAPTNVTIKMHNESSRIIVSQEDGLDATMNFDGEDVTAGILQFLLALHDKCDQTATTELLATFSKSLTKIHFGVGMVANEIPTRGLRTNNEKGRGHPECWLHTPYDLEFLILEDCFKISRKRLFFLPLLEEWGCPLDDGKDSNFRQARDIDFGQRLDRWAVGTEKSKDVNFRIAIKAKLEPKFMYNNGTFIMRLCLPRRQANRKLEAVDIDEDLLKLECGHTMCESCIDTTLKHAGNNRKKELFKVKS
ncbi:hypothetical protein CAEBREN_11161 [Caenorhabditis brenneri]|uniref:Zinc finger C3HC4 RING-type domain-containing protein n=1 Tax=Caenorhabditis brenneri TaxID=135651 RepID=G0MMC9_CAEBE|nr:hypothetical protein CAEBREN_11161 [Caenorhabditis brenneri]